MINIYIIRKGSMLALFLLLCTIGGSQNVENSSDNEAVALFDLPTNRVGGSKYFSSENEGYVLKLNQRKYNDFLTESPEAFTLEIPSNDDRNQPMVFRMMRSDILAEGAIGKSSDGSTYLDLKNQGNHYWGSIVGEEKVVAFSFYEDAVYGFISGTLGNYNLVKLDNEGSGTYGFYREEASEEDFECGLMDTDYFEEEEIATERSSEIETQRYPITISLEANNEVLANPNIGNGSVTQTINIMLSHFNIYAMVFANEEITIRITEIAVEAAGYTTIFPGPGMTTTGGNCPPNGTSNYLSQFQTARGNTYNADYAYLFVNSSCRAAGRAAAVGAYCGSSNLSRMGVGLMPAALPQGYELPAIHSRLNIFLHELGHLLGSWHTRQCIWNGNNTALDAGPNGDANNCYFGPDPAYYTIMASGGGVDDWQDFNLVRGFGVQPGQRLRDRIIQNISCFNEHIFCEANRYIFHRISDEFPVDYDAFYQALNIWADNSIVNTSRAVYVAENYIELLPGFNVETGSEFEAILVEDCLDYSLDNPESSNLRATEKSTAAQLTENSSFNISVVPNPSFGNFDVKIDKMLSSFEYHIFDLSGNKVLHEMKSDTDLFSVPGSHLNPGIYLVRVISNDEVVTTKVLIH